MDKRMGKVGGWVVGWKTYRLEGKMASPVYVNPAASKIFPTRARRASSLGEGVRTFWSSPLGSSTIRPETVVNAAAAKRVWVWCRWVGGLEERCGGWKAKLQVDLYT